MAGADVTESIEICVLAFRKGSEIITKIQEKEELEDEPRYSSRELVFLELLQEKMQAGERAISDHFAEEQRLLGEHAQFMRQGDAIAQQELMYTAMILQKEILNKLNVERGAEDTSAGLKSLLDTATVKREETVRSLTELRRRIVLSLPPAGGNDRADHRLSVGSAPKSVRDADNQSTGSMHSRDRGYSLETIEQAARVVPDVVVENLEAMTIQESLLEDDRFTIAPERPWQQVASAVPSSSRHAPQPRYVRPFSFSSSASMRAAVAPEYVPRSREPAIETVGPYFPQRVSAEDRIDQNLSVHPRPGRERTSVPESYVDPSDGTAWATRVISKSFLPSPSHSPGISEPDSAISFRMHNSKPYCSGASAAQQEFNAGFIQERLPSLPGSKKDEPCWKCKDCDFNAWDGEGKLLKRIDFNSGIRFRFKYLAKSHVAYAHPQGGISPRYQYGCQFCTAEGRQSDIFHTVESLMVHVRDKHSLWLTPEVRERTRCIVGRLGLDKEDWDVNIVDVTTKKNAVKNFFIRSVTSLPT